MSKDSDPKGSSRILKLSLNAAFGQKSPGHAATVRAQQGCKAEAGGDSGTTSNPISTSKLEVETVGGVFQEDVTNLDTQAGNVSKSPASKFGRGRGRKLAEKRSMPGLLLQNGEECVASNSCESQRSDVDLQSINVSLGVATVSDFSVIAAEKDTAETECVDMVLLTSKDKQRVDLKKEMTCELPDLVKCQISAGNINSTHRKKELDTDVGKQELASNCSALELASDSSTLECAAFSDKTMAAEHLSPSKTLISDTNISTREKTPNRVEKQATKAASPLVTPWKGKAAGDYTWYYRCKRTGQQFGARRKNYYTKNFSGPSERQREARPSKFLKQPGLDDHGEAYRDNLKYMRNLSKKQTQDKQFCIPGKETFRTQSCERNKQVRGSVGKQQEGNASKAKQQQGDASKGEQEGYARYGKQWGYTRNGKQQRDASKAKQQEGDAWYGKQEGDARYGKQEGDARYDKQEGDARYGKQEGDARYGKQETDARYDKQEGDARYGKQEGDARYGKQEGDARYDKQEGDARYGKQEGDARYGKQEGDAWYGKQEGDARYDKQEGDARYGKQERVARYNKQEGDARYGKQEGDGSKSKLQEGDAKYGKQGGDNRYCKQEGDARYSKQVGDARYGKQEGDARKSKQPEENASKCKQQKGDASKANQQIGEDIKVIQQMEDSSKAKQHEGDHGKSKQQEGDARYGKQEGDASKCKQQERDASKCKQHEGDHGKAKHKGDHSTAEQHEGDHGKAKQHEGDHGNAKHKGDVSKAEQHERDHGKAKQHEEDVNKSKQQKGNDSKASRQETGERESKHQEVNDSKDKHKINVGDYKQCGENVSQSKQEAKNLKPKQQKVTAINSGEMENMKNLDSDNRWSEQQNCLLVRESMTLAVDTLTNKLCQDTYEMPERERHISVQSKEDTSLKNLENFSSENIDNSVTLNVIVDGGKLDVQGTVLGTCSEFVGFNSSVHTMITAIYQSYEQETIQYEDKPAEIPGACLGLPESTDVEYVLEEAAAHAQEKCNLECFVSSTEKDIVAMGGGSAAEETSEGCTFVQMGEGSLYVYAERGEVIKSASEERIGDIVCAGKEERDSGLTASEKQEVIVCEVSASVAKDNSEDNDYLSEDMGELCVFSSGEEGADVSPSEQKGEVSASVAKDNSEDNNYLSEDKEELCVFASIETGDYVSPSEQKGEVIVYASEQKGEVIVSTSEVRGETLRNYEDLLVKNVNYETVNINQDVENDFQSASISPQEISRPSCHMSDISCKWSADLPTSTESEHNRSCEANLIQNPANERSTNYCTSRAADTMMYSPNIMGNQAGHAQSNVCDASHQDNLYTSRHSDSYSSSDLPLFTCEEKENSSSPAPFFDRRDLSMPAETLGSEAAMNRIMAFLTSCSANIQQYMNQYSENQPLDVTISVSLTQPPLSDYTPRLAHPPANLWDRGTTRPPCPPPFFPYPGWLPAHPPYWNWWPWLERYPCNIPTPGNSIPFHYPRYPPTMYPVSTESRDTLPPVSPDVHHLPPSQPSANNQGPAPRAPADYLYSQMFSHWMPAVCDYPSSRQRSWSPEMATNHTNGNVDGVDYSGARLQTSEDVGEGKTWNDDNSTVYSEQHTPTVGQLGMHQKGYLLEYPSNETSTSWEGINGDDDRHRSFHYNSVSSCLSKERLTNNWNSRMTPPAASNRHQNVRDSSRTATPAASSSNQTSRSCGFEPKPNSVHQEARGKSAPNNRKRPWVAHQTKNKRRLSYPAAAAAPISDAGQCNNMEENKQVESKTSSSPPSDEFFKKKRERDWAMSFIARSRKYNYKFIDTHCHIDYIYSKMDVPRETSFSKFQQEHAKFPYNYEGCVAVFCNPNTFNADNPKDHILQNVSMEDGIWLAVGCHPKNANEFTDAHLKGLRNILKHPKVVALGEIGLDYSGIFSQYSDTQKLVFRQQLELALELQLPLVIHCRDADDDCLEILTEMVPSDYKIHAHCFTRDISVAMRWMLPFPNLFLGLTPVVTYKTALDTVNTAAFIPLDRLLLETDAPFFVPNGLHQDITHSHPGFALFTAEKVAQLKHISVDEVLKACRENTHRMYGI